jgi:hypothetical protein
LRNDLNFERYLKQQHLSHIGQLRRKQIKEARVEAETQNLVNTNRLLRNKVDEAKRANAQVKKETEKSKAHSRNWETELSGKLRVLREEQKKWNIEREILKRDLEIAHDKAEKLKQLVVMSESRELGAKQKMMSVESSLDELERLRTEVENLTLRIRKYEARDLDVQRTKENEAEALRRAKILEMQLAAREHELLRSKQEFEKELHTQTSSMREKREEEYVQKTTLSQEILDSVLASSRQRITELEKRHKQLLKNYTALQGHYVALKEKIEQSEDGEEALLGGGVSGYRSQSPSPPPNQRSATFPMRPARLDTNSSSGSGGHGPASPVEGRGKSPVTASSAGHQAHFNTPKPFSPNVAGSGKGSVDAESLDTYGSVKKKIQPSSEVRVYGRGKRLSFSPILSFLN